MHSRDLTSKIKPGLFIQTAIWATRTGDSKIQAANLGNDHGMSGDCARSDLHDNHPQGHTMWLVQEAHEDLEIVIDLQGFYPVGEMWFWNYNRFDPKTPDIDYTACGLKQIRIFHSVDKENWEELKGTGYPYQLARASGRDNLPATNLLGGSPVDFGGLTAKFIRITAPAITGAGNWGGTFKCKKSFGLSKIRVYTGSGFAVVPDRQWTDLLHNKRGWTGGDGTFSVPMDGCDAPGGSAADTMFLFGDTLIGSIDPITDQRAPDFTMINNSCIVLKNSIPKRENLNHIWRQSPSGTPDSLFIPDPAVQNDQSSQAYYWPQDGLVTGNNFYNFPMTVMNDPEGPEGFQFKIDGVAMLSVPVRDGRLRTDHITQSRTGLYQSGSSSGGQLIFGGNFLPNTRQAGAPDPDGYIYVYGHRSRGLIKDLCVARIPEAAIANVDDWRFWNGSQWSDDISECAVIAENVSCELSVTPLRGRLHAGKYLLVFQELVNSPIISCRLGDSPWGPFGDIIRLYSCPEVTDGRSIYAYNAKGHPHLSREGELLISYNVNSTSWQAHVRHGYIYGPRFLRLIEVCE